MIRYKPAPQRHRRSSGRRLWRALFSAICLLAVYSSLLAVVAHAQTPQASAEMDLSSYESELNRVAESVQHPEQIPELRKSLPRTWPVRVSDTTVQVPTGWLRSDLKHLEQDPAEAASISRDVVSRLAAMRSAAVALEQRPVTTSLNTAQAKLDKILSAREFGAAQGPSQWDLLKARIARWISLQIYKLLSRLHLGAKAGNTLAWIIVGIAFLALCYWVWKTLFTPNRKGDIPVEVATRPDDPRLWARDALAAADRGDYREAMHCAYWAAVVHLETLGMLKRDRARTPRESLRLLDPHPNEQNLLREFTRRFELIWYGYRPASANDWSEARSHLEKMGCLTPSTPATANS
jgi:hypothetical protein